METAKEDIARQYARLGNHELIRMVGVDSRSYGPEALEVAIEELRQRGLSKDSFDESASDHTNDRRTRSQIGMKHNRTVPLLLGVASSASGLLIIASVVPEYIKTLDALTEAPGFNSRLIVGCCFVLFGCLLIFFNRHR